ncbi:MAG: ROK family protein [Actinomycetaceae bacterium]|nr:ROK family protein [Actinomycetaceae bacterium]
MSIRFHASSSKGARHANLRNHNLSLLAQTIVHAPHPLSRAELSTLTDLDRSTLTRLTEKLLQQGIIREGNPVIYGSGRPLIPLEAARKTYGAVGVDIICNELIVYAIDLSGMTLFHDRIPVDAGSKRGVDVLHKTGAVIKSVYSSIDKDITRLCGIGCGFPGLVDEEKRILHFAPNLGWADLDVIKELKLEKQLKGLPVHVGNGTAMAAIAEVVHRKRHDSSINTFIFITGDDGIGAACVRDGMIDSGMNGWGGEIGHLPMGNSPNPCHCGAVGCLETFCSRSAIQDSAGVGCSNQLDEVLRALAAGEERAFKAVMRAGRYLGMGLSAYINLVDIQTVVFSGVYGQLFPYLRPVLEKEMEKRTICAKWHEIQLIRSDAGVDLGAKGAAWKSIDYLLDNPSLWK